jgi:hypothetical protein
MGLYAITPSNTGTGGQELDIQSWFSKAGYELPSTKVLDRFIGATERSFFRSVIDKLSRNRRASKNWWILLRGFLALPDCVVARVSHLANNYADTGPFGVVASDRYA